MSRFVKNILDVLGGKTFWHGFPPQQPGIEIITLNIQWSGKSLRVIYNIISGIHGVVYAEYKELFVNGNESSETINIRRVKLHDRSTACYGVYFKCSGVTSLIVNGERII